MATLKQRLHRKNASGTYDTIQLETNSSIVMRPSGRSVEQDLTDFLPKSQASDTVPNSLKKGQLVAGNTKAWLMTNSRKELSFSGHTHSGYASSSHTHSQYSLNNHTHTEYSTIGHTHPQYMTENDVIELINTRPPAAQSLTLELGISDLTRKVSDGNTYYEYNKNLVSLTGFTPVSVTIYSSFTMNLTAEYNGEYASYLTALNKTYDFSISGSDYTLLPGDETYNICNTYSNTMKVPDTQYQENREAYVFSAINFIFNNNYNLTFGFKSGFQYRHDGGSTGGWRPTSVHLNTTSINSFYCKLLILGERSN